MPAAGANVVVTGRVTDASLVVGPAAAHFGWALDDFDALAGAMAAGHVIECGAQATGGNYSFFTEIADLRHPGFPIAEIYADGSSVITKHPGTGGAVTVGTVTAQLLYEVAGPRYAGPDATLRLDTVQLRQDGPDRVAISGVRGEPPPPTLKVSLNALGGYRNQVEFVLTGLDIERQGRARPRPARRCAAGRRRSGSWPAPTTPTPTPRRRPARRCAAWSAAPIPKAIGRAFSGAAVELALASYPGFHLTAPPGDAQPYGVFTAAYLDRAEVQQVAVLPDGRSVPVRRAGHDRGRWRRPSPPPCRRGRRPGRRGASRSGRWPARAAATRAATPTSASGRATRRPGPGWPRR